MKAKTIQLLQEALALLIDHRAEEYQSIKKESDLLREIWAELAADTEKRDPFRQSIYPEAEKARCAYLASREKEIPASDRIEEARNALGDFKQHDWR